MANYQVVIIGGGPGGYSAAIRAAQLGLSCAVIEKDRLGGVCLNRGCIPTKSLLASAHLYEKMKRADEFGIEATEVNFKFPAVIQRAQRVADEMAQGVAYLMKKNGITVIPGRAVLKTPERIVVENGDSESHVEAQTVIIAVGARPRSLPGLDSGEENIITAYEALTSEELPEKICIVGGGYIGCEFADFFSAAGSEVTLLEFLPRILAQSDAEVVRPLERALKKRGVKLISGARVTSASKAKGGVDVKWETEAGGAQTESFSKVLVATGITANTDKLGLHELGVELVEDRIRVDERYRSSVANIYAIGDCIPGPALAHLAAAEGIRAVEAIAIQQKLLATDYEPINYNAIPAGIYTHPEVASVGLTESEAQKSDRQIKIGRFHFKASGRARAQGESDGMVKIIADEQSGELLGIHCSGALATELLAEGALAISSEATVETIARTIHAHPTFSEGLMEAAGDLLLGTVHSLK